jgi:hypothetical protein
MCPLPSAMIAQADRFAVPATETDASGRFIQDTKVGMDGGGPRSAECSLHGDRRKQRWRLIEKFQLKRAKVLGNRR